MQDSSTYPVQRTFSTPPSEFKPPEPPALGPDAEPELWEYWDVIRRHIKLIAGLFVISELLTLLLVLVMTPLYTGLSTILIESQAPRPRCSNPTPTIIDPVAKKSRAFIRLNMRF